MQRQRAFSVMELVVVMAIICILVACLAPALSSALRKAHQTADDMSDRYPIHQASSSTGAGYWNGGRAGPEPAPVNQTGGGTGGDSGTTTGGSGGSTTGGTTGSVNRKIALLANSISPD